MTTPRLAAFLPSHNPTTRAILRCLVSCAASVAFSDRAAPRHPASPPSCG